MLSPWGTFESKRIRRLIAGSFAAVRYVTTLLPSRLGATVVGKMHTAGLRGEPLAAVQSELRKEWLEDLDLAIEAMKSVGIGLIAARFTLEALQSENSDLPVNLPVRDVGQSVLNLATEQDQ
jgi:hypothetical protein